MATSALAKFREIECVRWFRGLSMEQITACNNLLHALRDDTEQGTTYRVRFCFSQLGLHPPVPSKQLEAIMKISHCNDLAFLWFIWEAEYKQPRDHSNSINIDNESFSVNEQLLFSAMAHLDMPATLRALDRILPPPSRSKKFVKEENNHVHVGSKDNRIRSPHNPRQYLSPYFAPLVRPKQFVPKNRPMPDFQKVDFPEYSRYKDPMYEIPNEKSRWFSQYELSPGKRIVKKFLTEELDRLFFDSSPLFSQSGNEGNALCNTHRSMEEEMALKQKELTHEALQKCLAQLDVIGFEKQARQKRIVESLEKEIQCAADKMHQFSRRQHTQVRMLRSDGIDADCRLCQRLVSLPPPKRGRKADLSLLMQGCSDPVGHPMPPGEDNTPFLKVLKLRGDRRPHSCCEAGDCTMIGMKSLGGKQRKSSRTNMIGRSLAGEAAKRHSRKKLRLTKHKESIVPQGPTTNFKNIKDLIPVCGLWKKCANRRAHYGQQASYMTKCTCGIQLDYFKIFDPPELPPLPLPELDRELGEFGIDIEDKQPLIERYCVNALSMPLNDDAERQKCPNAEDSISLTNAIDKCAISIFNEEKAIKDKEEAAKLKTSIDRDTLLKVTNIDPDDRNQMIELLKSGLKILRRNPRFVLATLWNAHKLPILVDWVADRYGKTYQRKEMDQMVNSSFHIYEQLDRRRRKPLGKLHRTDVRGMVSYDDHARIMRRAHCMKMKYHRELNEEELEQSRLIWLALRGYSHLSSFIGDTFFAYMPSREMDLKRHNVWKQSDYRDMVETRVRLRHRKQQK